MNKTHQSILPGCTVLPPMEPLPPPRKPLVVDILGEEWWAKFRATTAARYLAADHATDETFGCDEMVYNAVFMADALIEELKKEPHGTDA